MRMTLDGYGEGPYGTLQATTETDRWGRSPGDSYVYRARKGDALLSIPMRTMKTNGRGNNKDCTLALLFDTTEEMLGLTRKLLGALPPELAAKALPMPVIAKVLQTWELPSPPMVPAHDLRVTPRPQDLQP